MSNELAYHNPIGETDTIYAVLKNWRNRAQVVNPSTLALVTLVAADWADYDIPMAVSVATSGDYLADMPSVAAGKYLVEVYIETVPGTKAITDQLVSAYTIDWSGTGLAVAAGGDWSGSTAIYTAKALYDDMKAITGTGATGATGRATVVANMVKLTAGAVWNLAPWMFRHVVLDLVTVAGQAYTTLPTNYARIPQFGDWLVESSADTDRPRYVPPALFEQMRANLDDDGLQSGPEIFTLGFEEINSVYTPVVRWLKTPTSVKTYKGFQYFRAFPGVDVTDDVSVVFPDVAFDDLWEMFCVRRLAHRIKLPETVNIPTLTERNEAVEDARANLEYKPSMSIPLDVYRDTEDVYGLAVAGGAEMYDTDGGLLVGDEGY